LIALDLKFKNAIENLDKFKPILSHLGSANNGVEMVIGIGKTISQVNHPWKAHIPVV